MSGSLDCSEEPALVDEATGTGARMHHFVWTFSHPKTNPQQVVHQLATMSQTFLNPYARSSAYRHLLLCRRIQTNAAEPRDDRP